MTITGGSLFALAILAFCGFLLAGFCVWKMGETMERLQEALEKEQAFRLAEREAEFRQRKFLITVLLKNDPQLADTLSKMPATEKEQPEDFMMNLAGVGEVMGSRRPL